MSLTLSETPKTGFVVLSPIYLLSFQDITVQMALSFRPNMHARREHTILQTFRQSLRIVSLVPGANIVKEKETLRQQETAMLAGTALVAPTVPTQPHTEENVMLALTALKVSFNP